MPSKWIALLCALLPFALPLHAQVLLVDHCPALHFSCQNAQMMCLPLACRCDGQVQCNETALDEADCGAEVLLDLTLFTLVRAIDSTEKVILVLLVLLFLFINHKLTTCSHVQMQGHYEWAQTEEKQEQFRCRTLTNSSIGWELLTSRPLVLHANTKAVN